MDTVPKDLELIARLRTDPVLRAKCEDVLAAMARHRYMYNFTWLGRPVIQLPQDLVAIQEIVWRYRPDAIVETGIAHGGSLIFSASMLQLLGGDGIVVGVDIDIRAHNRAAIEAHPLSQRIRMIEGSSIDAAVIREVKAMVARRSRVIVVLDSNHTEEHVLAELRAYASLVRRDGYLIVLDTVVEVLPDDLYGDRPWSVGNNPMTALDRFLPEDRRFEIDPEFDQKLLFSVAPRGFLRAVRDPDPAPDGAAVGEGAIVDASRR